jgi:D-serine deaminase-like pyridoxal phosphate-dependent protein
MTYDRYRRAIAGEPLPLAIVDLDAVDANVDALAQIVRPSKKALRFATKSIRCPELVRYAMTRLGPIARGLMTFTASETAWLASQGHDDLLLAYPTAHPRDAALVAEANARGARAAVVVDDAAHVDAMDAAARARGTKIPVVIDIDLSYRPLGNVHVGVRRSPIRTVEQAVALAHHATARSHVELLGLMGYEAQIAGVPDLGPSGVAVRAMKRRSRVHVEAIRRALADAIHPRLFNGGGTGSLAWASAEPWLTEVTAGSGVLASHLFDRYRGLSLSPAAFFALQVVRAPARGIVTCHGGGYVASGEAGASRLPVPALPSGCKLLGLEGAGEVQTPVVLPRGVRVAIGDPIFFRHAKAGELAEHFREYVFVRNDRIVGRAPTYRGLGHCFL